MMKCSRWLKRSVGSLLFVTLTGSALHWSVRRLGIGACPMGDVSAKDLEKARRIGFATLETAGSPRAPQRTFYGYTLGETKREQFLAGEQAHSATCTLEIEAAMARCIDTMGTEIVAQFAADSTLVGLDRTSARMTETAAIAQLQTSLQTSLNALGQPSRTWGEQTEAFLRAPLRQAGAEFRFADLSVDVTATQMGTGAVIVREQMRALGKGTQG